MGLLFFRDPDRFPIKDENYLVSPADGKITQIMEINGPEELGLEKKRYTRISIFMDILSHYHFDPFPKKDCSKRLSQAGLTFSQSKNL